jgi:hypothetical protein
MISNAISVSTSASWYFFTSFMNRDKTFEKMVTCRRAVLEAREAGDHEEKDAEENGNASPSSSSMSESEEIEVEEGVNGEKLVLLADQNVKGEKSGRVGQQYVWYAVGFVLVICWVSMLRLHLLLGSVERNSDADFEMLKRMMIAGKSDL